MVLHTMNPYMPGMLSLTKSCLISLLRPLAVLSVLLVLLPACSLPSNIKVVGEEYCKGTGSTNGCCQQLQECTKKCMLLLRMPGNIPEKGMSGMLGMSGMSGLSGMSGMSRPSLSGMSTTSATSTTSSTAQNELQGIFQCMSGKPASMGMLSGTGMVATQPKCHCKVEQQSSSTKRESTVTWPGKKNAAGRQQMLGALVLVGMAVLAAAPLAGLL